MKYYTILFITILFLTGFSLKVLSQISPGDLVAVHAHLEGITNCTKCHVLGEKLTNDKCLECHKEIRDLTTNKKGYHASSEVLGKECFSCHSDHHGRTFKIINFDRDKFDHKKSGFELLGKHKEIECTACHKPEFIKVKITQRKAFSYLGLETECKSCHVDYHRNTLSSKCTSCHNFNSFKPATEFDHQLTKFPMVGKHVKVACERCHKTEIVYNTKFQQFAGVQFANCTNCHKDPHGNKFGQNCKKCHNEESFHNVSGMNSFDHNKTNYPLTGKHTTVNCADCHKGNYTQPIKHNLCSNCHTDYHKGQFTRKGISPDCNECHNKEGFTKTLYTVEKHNTTLFKLDGKHLTTNCSGCHKKGNEWDFQNMGRICSDCHADYHKGQFSKGGISPGCNECHDLQAFTNTIFSIDQHNRTDFSLKGAHLATPCFSCHKKNNFWQFTRIGKNCVDCHINIHRNFIDERYYPNQDCRFCHTESEWTAVKFDHSVTNFVLKDKHAEISCKQCHLFDKKEGKIIQKFTGLSDNCLTCHKDSHNHQFEENGTTLCHKCHGFKSWKADLFNHDNTRFKLGISHGNLKCDKCHNQVKSNSGTYIFYKINKVKCADCHS